jgi:hypothetical protein
LLRSHANELQPRCAGIAGIEIGREPDAIIGDLEDDRVALPAQGDRAATIPSQSSSAPTLRMRSSVTL